LYASSMTTYGPQDTLPVLETSVCRPVSYYGISKYAAERFVHAMALRNDLPNDFHVTSFRMFNVYGPRQSLTNPYQGALAIFIGNVLRGEPTTIFGDGKQTRDFIYIDDVVGAWMNAMPEKRAFGKIYNLGRGEQISVNQMVRTVITAAGKDPSSYRITYKNERPGEQRFMEADMRTIKHDIGFTPSVPFNKGLKKTFVWAQSQ